MKWRKLGLIYGPKGENWWAKSHAIVPTPVLLGDAIRVYVSCCDEKGVARISFVELSANDPTRILYISPKPVLDIGEPGTFDENGVMACSIVIDEKENHWKMYYVGFELGTKIRYRLLTGLAISEDCGKTFKRLSKTPVLERSDKELYFRCGPFCIYESGIYRLWYVAGSGWLDLEGKQMPIYDIRYAESDDGIQWPSEGKILIPISKEDEHGFGRPAVIRKAKDDYRMFYSIRSKRFKAYRLGYAESKDGIIWHRMDEKLNLNVSFDGFDSEAIMYAVPLEVNDRFYLFYNGNDFGRDGFAMAILEQD